MRFIRSFFCPNFYALLIVFLLCLQSSIAVAGQDPSEQPLKRKGVVMGLDPGLALRFNDEGTTLYARMNLRIGGCFNERIQLGVDWRMEIMVAGVAEPWLNRHEIGPVLTVFLKKGWFIRPHIHLHGFKPFALASGFATGYEWELGRFSGAGISLGGDAIILFNGEPPAGYAAVFSFYLTAYDLKTRRGRNNFK